MIAFKKGSLWFHFGEIVFLFSDAKVKRRAIESNFLYFSRNRIGIESKIQVKIYKLKAPTINFYHNGEKIDAKFE